MCIQDRKRDALMSKSKDTTSPHPTAEPTTKPCVFIHTNPKQWLGALVSQYSLKRNSAHADAFDVRIIHTDDHPFLQAREGQLYLRDGLKRLWLMDDTQSFTPLRFMPPKLMNYGGRAVIMDPDVFAVGDIHELLSRDMQGKSVMCRSKRGAKAFASSVMLLDCSRLKSWDCEAQFNEMFEFKLDYMEWIFLKCEPPETIGLLEEEWNDFDRLTEKTKLLHNTKRLTQPWKTGLRIDYTPALKTRRFRPLGWLRRSREMVFGRYGMLGRYKPHPDPNQENYFFGLLRECLNKGVVSEDILRDEMKEENIRPDALEVIERTPDLTAANEKKSASRVAESAAPS
jgi:hypothetical protein